MSVVPQTRPSLLLRLRDTRDSDAWTDFVRLYTPLIFRYCQRLGLQEADAADVAQEVMRVASHQLPAFHYDVARGKFRGWLLQTTRHRVRQWIARRQRAPEPVEGETLERLLEPMAAADEDGRWEDDYRQRVFDWAADKARGEFQTSTWEAFWRTASNSVSVKEVATQLGISVGAVYIARSRVTARLRELIETVTEESIANWQD
ncbi:MAG: sigma-70 family RNA polymerase sigma factor [Verrucomicrobiales bacterium]|nr:sigma-70 family RNA polymerase sigma factor [Verrucomicrobiales bacterium]